MENQEYADTGETLSDNTQMELPQTELPQTEQPQEAEPPVATKVAEDAPFTEETSETEGTSQLAGDESSGQTVTPEEDRTETTEPTSTQTDTKEDMYGAQADALREVYPTFDLEREMRDPAFRGLVCGEVRPTLAQAYALCHGEELMAEAVRTAVEAAVAEAESRLTEHIAARGLRPCENGTSPRGAVRMHPSVDHLTREDRAMLAKRAGRGESIRL